MRSPRPVLLGRRLLVNLVAGLVAYCHQPKKPSLGLFCGCATSDVAYPELMFSGLSAIVANLIWLSRKAKVPTRVPASWRS